MEDAKPKSFWQKPEGTTGAITIALIAVGGIFLAWNFLPAIITLLQNTIHATILGIVLAAIIFCLLDTRIRALVWYMYTVAMKTITGMFIEINPIKILESYIVYLQKMMGDMNEHITRLSQEVRKLKNVIDKNKGDMERELGVASEAKKRNNSPQAAISVRQAERLQKSNTTLIELLAKIENMYNVLTKVYTNAGYLLKDTENEVDIKKREYTAIQAGHSAFKAAMKIIKGDDDKMALFNQAMEFVTDDVANKIGEVERFMQLSKNALDRVDLENAVFEEKGFKLLEEWEKNSSILNSSGSGASATVNKKYSNLF